MKTTGSSKSKQARGKVIAAAKKKTGENTDWKKLFAKLDGSKKGGR